MLMVPVQVPTDVLAEAPEPTLPAQIWDTDDAIPDALALQWTEDRPLEQWSISLLAGIDPATLPERDLPAYIKACDRVQSAFAARADRATLQMAGPSDTGKNFREFMTPAHELSVALRIPVGAASGIIYRSRQLAKLPATRALYADGRISARHVAKITTATGGLTPHQCAQVEDLALTNAEHLSVHEFARRVRRAVAKVHPRTAKQRHTQAAAQSDVTFQPADDAMGWLTSVMPLIDALTCKNAYDHYALAKKKAGDPRPLGVLRAEAQRVFAEYYLSGLLTGTVPTHHGRPVEVHVAVTPDALLGLSDTPAEIPGIGPVPIEIVRAMIHDAKIRWLTISATNGALLDRNPTTWRIPPAVHAHADTAYPTSVGPHSTVPAERCDGEHLTPYPHGPTDITNIAPMDRRWHLPKTHTPGMTVQRNPDASITWTTPLGQTITIHPYDYRLGP